MRKSDFIIIRPFVNFSANVWEGILRHRPSIQQIARDALLVAPVRLAELPFQIGLLAPDDGEVAG